MGLVGRRQFLVASSVLLAARLARAQSMKLKRIGVLQEHTTQAAMRWHGAFAKGLAERDWVEGKNVVTDLRSADGQIKQLPGLANEIVALKPDLIFAPTTVAARAAVKATGSIPIVFASVSNPVAAGLATSLARPGGNATGLTNIAADLGAKRLEILRQAVPGATRVAAMHAGDFTSQVQLAELRRAASSLGLDSLAIETKSPGEYEGAVGAMLKWRADVVVVIGSAPMFTHRKLIIGHLAKARLPASYANRDFVVDGGLISYGPDFADLFRRAAAYVDRIFKGARPGDLPIEQPSKFELVINLKTANALGLSMPISLLSRADEMIQ